MGTAGDLKHEKFLWSESQLQQLWIGKQKQKKNRGEKPEQIVKQKEKDVEWEVCNKVCWKWGHFEVIWGIERRLREAWGCGGDSTLDGHIFANCVEYLSHQT